MSQKHHGILLSTLTGGLLAMVLLAPAHPFLAQDAGEADDIKQTVARVAYVSGSASFNRGDDPENWQEATVNFPLTLGDRIYTGKDGRMELQASSTRIFVAPDTELSALDLRDDVRQLSISGGTATFRVRDLSENEVFEVDTPNISVTFKNPGDYRVDVDKDGNTRVLLRKGGALAVAGGGQVDLNDGDAIKVDGIDEPRYDMVGLPGSDSWDRWVDERCGPRREALSAQYVSSDIEGIEDLDEGGSWEDVPEYGHAWTPHAVDASWAPYRDGRWGWQDPWGWTWIARERWGWAPYHYGSWFNHHNRWFWSPGHRGERSVRYSPARVAFMGGGPGGEAGHMGWFPIGPRDRFVPWWGRGAGREVSVRNVSYMNRGFVTVVRRDTFVGGGYVRDGFIRDGRIIREVSTGRFLHGPLPFMPTLGTVRFAHGRGGLPIPRPPQIFAGRAVVTRLAPPLRPPSFEAKMGFIRQNHGRPVDRISADRISVDHFHGQRSVVNVRPAFREGGKVAFVPKRDFGGGHRVLPAVVPQGRAHATVNRPAVPFRDMRSVERSGPRPEVRRADRPGDRPEMRRVGRPVDRPELRKVDRPANRPELRKVERPEARRVDRPVERPEMRKVDRPVDRPEMRKVDRPVERRVDRPVARPELRKVDRPSDRPELRKADHPVAKPEVRKVDRPVDRPEMRKVDRPVERRVERPVTKPEPRAVARQPEQRAVSRPPVAQAPKAQVQPRVEKPRQPPPDKEKKPRG